MSNLRGPVRRIHHFLHVFAGTVTPYHPNELLDVVAAKFEHRHSGLFVELRRAIVIGGLGYVVKLMLNQGAELQIIALLAVVGSQSDDEFGIRPNHSCICCSMRDFCQPPARIITCSH